MPIALAMFDMAATTVNDTIDGRPLVLQSFAESFAAAQVAVPWEALNAQRGKDKLEVFRLLLASHGGLSGAVLAQTAQALLQVGARTIAVASGTQPADMLAQAGAAAVLPAVAALPDYLATQGYLGS